MLQFYTVVSQFSRKNPLSRRLGAWPLPPPSGYASGYSLIVNWRACEGDGGEVAAAGRRDDGDEHTRRDTAVSERLRGDAEETVGHRVARTDRHLCQLHLLDFGGHRGDDRVTGHEGRLSRHGGRLLLYLLLYKICIAHKFKRARVRGAGVARSGS